MALLMLVDADKNRQLKMSLILTLRNLLIAAVVSFCLAAPVLLPFVEYLINSDSYKFSIGGSTWIPWQGIAYNLIQPGFGGVSPYLGIITAIVLPLSIVVALKGQRMLLCLIASAVIALMVTARQGPFYSLFMAKPFNCLITVYCMPILLLLIAMISARGLEELVERTSPGLDLSCLSILIGLGIA